MSADSRARSALKRDVLAGGITLVLGAGVSKSWGAPEWNDLVRAVGGTMPAKGSLSPQLRLDALSRQLGPAKFVSALRTAIYAGAREMSGKMIRTSPATLARLARLVVAELARAGARRVVRVVSFNVDDLLEQAVNALKAPGRRPVVRVLARESHHPVHGTGEQPVPIYHLHGYLPREESSAWHDEAPDCLVFTDSDYWSTTATPASFANRVMAHALHDSHCVFIGMSMTDPNQLRWLAVRAEGLREDKLEQFSRKPGATVKERRVAAETATARAIGRHWWIRTPEADVDGIISGVVESRGVRSVVMASWDEFATLIDGIFDPNPVAKAPVKMVSKPAASKKPAAKKAAPQLAKPAKAAPVGDAAEKILAHIKANPGQRSEDVRKAVGTAKNIWILAIAKLVDDKKIVKRGEKRATSFTAK